MKTFLAVVSIAVLAAGCVITSDDDTGPCTSADNNCSTPWDLNYCDEVSGNMFASDCQNACTTDEATWSQACDTPALAGECDDVGGVCLCYCEDAFDSCLNDDTVHYIRDGVPYDLSCKDYCGGTCDADLGACLCP